MVEDGLVVGGIAALIKADGSYDEWDKQDWDDFWDDYRAYMATSVAIGPVVAGLNLIRPSNYIPFANDDAADDASADKDRVNKFEWERGPRNAESRAAQSNERAIDMNVAGFLTALMKSQNVRPSPILPCYGSPKVEAFKRASMSQGVTFTTDSCHYKR